MADTLASMFPGRARGELQAALEQCGGSLEAAVELLLSGGSAPARATPGDGGLGDHPSVVYDTGNAIADRARARQLEQDEIMARALALEDEQAAAASPLTAARSFAEGMFPAGGGQRGGEQALPSMDSIGEALQPVVAGIQSAGRSAVSMGNWLYDEIVGGASASEAQQQHVMSARRRAAAEADQNETHVLRGDAVSPRRPGLQARPRRTGYVDGAGGSAEKKRE